MWFFAGTGPINATASWKSGPNERGTLSILSSCIFTLVLCLYSALHLNIPEHGESRRKQYLRKLKWVLLGLFAPEIIAIAAFFQWSHARKLDRNVGSSLREVEQRVRDHASKKGEPVPTAREWPWTRVHSFYAVMGGFAFDTSHLSQNFLPDGRTQVTLTAQGVLDLAKSFYEHQLIPDVSEKSIWDKSKANGLAKAIVCFQALWFCVQVSGRLVARLPTSLFEINTLAHAACCLVVYIIWWNKPLDIEEPTPIPVNGPRAEAVCAGYIMESPIGFFRPCHPIGQAHARTRGFLMFDPIAQRDLSRRFGPSLPPPESHTSASFHHATHSSLSLKFPSSYSNHRFYSVFPFAQDLERHIFEYVMPLDLYDLRRLDLARSWLLEYEMLHAIYNQRMKNDCENIGRVPIHHRKKRFDGVVFERLVDEPKVQYRAANMHFPKYDYFTKDPCMVQWSILLDNVRSQLAWDPPYIDKALELPGIPWLGDGWSKYAVVICAESAYGLLHLLSWNTPFATYVELVLWQASSLILVAPLALLTWYAFLFVSWYLCRCAMYMSGKHFALWWLSYEFKKHAQTWRITRVVADFLLSGFFLVYILARIYIIVESVKSIAYLPEGAYKEPQWSQFVPHFGAG